MNLQTLDRVLLYVVMEQKIKALFTDGSLLGNHRAPRFIGGQNLPIFVMKQPPTLVLYPTITDHRVIDSITNHNICPTK